MVFPALRDAGRAFSENEMSDLFYLPLLYGYVNACVAVPHYFRMTDLADIARLHGLRLVWSKTARRLEARP